MKKNITVQLEEKDIQMLKEIANADNRSIASYLRNVILDLIKNNESKRK